MSVFSIYFSPTYNTKKICNLIAEEFGDYREIDLSKCNKDYDYSFKNDDICIIAVPSFGGRVPNIVLERMLNFKADFTKAILVVVYGNRHYDDTLIELSDFIKRKKFINVASITAIAEHSIINSYAKGRPNNDDIKELKGFASKIIEKLNSEYSVINIPGNHPYKNRSKTKMIPMVNDKCEACLLCAKLCPVFAIDINNLKNINIDKCISCMRCIKICPHNARYLNKDLYEMIDKKLSLVASDFKTNELFME